MEVNIQELLKNPQVQQLIKAMLPKVLGALGVQSGQGGQGGNGLGDLLGSLLGGGSGQAAPAGTQQLSDALSPQAVSDTAKEIGVSQETADQVTQALPQLLEQVRSDPSTITKLLGAGKS